MARQFRHRRRPKNKAKRPSVTISRRAFLQYTAGAGAMLGASQLVGCGSDDGGGGGGSSSGPGMEPRTYVFNFSNFDTSDHNLILVAGKRRIHLLPTSQANIEELRRQFPILRLVADDHLTHYIELDMPSAAIQLCWVRRELKNPPDGNWDMAHIFYHLPTSALLEAKRRRIARAGGEYPPVPVKWLRYGLTGPLRDELDDPVAEEVLQDCTTSATALVAGYPELSAGEPNSAADIQTNIINTQPATATLGGAIDAQGPATTGGGWATMTPFIDPTTGLPYMNSEGKIQQMPYWSSETGQYCGDAISPSLDMVKDTTDLGTNITDVDPTQITTNDATAPTNGSVWVVQDGMSSVDQSTDSGLQGDEAVQYQLTNQSPGHGYSLEVKEVGVNSNGLVTVSLTCKNWYVRYLSIFVRYLNGDGEPIQLSSVASEIQNSFEFWDEGYNGTYDAYLSLLYPEFQVIGIPVKTAELERTITIPREAASVQILAGGMGSGSNPYPDTIDQGVAMTAIFNLSVPSLLLSLMAAAGYGELTESLQDSETVRECLEEGIEFFAWAGLDFDDTDGFQDLAVDLGEKLLSSGAAKIDALIAASIAEGESIEAVEDAIPIVGAFLSAIWAIGLIADLAETSDQVSQSPRTYIDQINFTHDVQVTLKHDPDDPFGFPATATYFVVTALFDNGSPQTIQQDMPGTTVTDPIVVTFKGVPAGGMVKVDVGFYSDTTWLAGQGTVGPVQNQATEGVLDLEIVITENLVPIDGSTKYGHKEKIELDSNGNHIWAATAAPTTKTPDGLCSDTNGQICAWTGITISTKNAAIGYAWQSYNSAVHDCVSGALGQLNQFANISGTQNPESGYVFSGCGFSGVTRIVYDLMDKPDWNFYLDTTNGGNYIRQLHLDTTPATFDSPMSNKAWGKLQFPSDALLLHPLGKIISVNTERSKLEVLTLSSTVVTDAQAPISQVRSGVGTREGLMQSPVHAAVTAQGTVLVLEAINSRIQAFDVGGNPSPIFRQNTYHFPLVDPPGAVTYLDLAVEYSGYIYVLSYSGSGSSAIFNLDIYTPEGDWLTRTTGLNSARVAVNYWRDIYTLNYEVLKLPNGQYPNKTEPSVSHWIPSTPTPTPTPKQS